MKVETQTQYHIKRIYCTC